MYMNNLNIIHHVCSLGTLCSSSQLCKDTGLKQESYPFDWIFSNPDIIVDIIKDNFTNFLNKELYINSTINKCGHALYGDNIFNHHNPKDNDEHYSYFTRCVERFRILLRKTESNKLFIITFTNINNEIEDIESIKNTILNFNNYISTKTTNHSIFAICHIPHQNVFKSNIEDIANIKFVSLYTKSGCDGTVLIDKTENEMLQKLLLDAYLFQIQKL